MKARALGLELPLDGFSFTLAPPTIRLEGSRQVSTFALLAPSARHRLAVAVPRWSSEAHPIGVRTYEAVPLRSYRATKLPLLAAANAIARDS